MEGQGYPTPQALLSFLTTVFRGFAEQAGLTVLSAAIDKHGSWEWSAGATTDLNRSVSLYLTELRRTAALSGSYLAETWAEAEDAKRFTRRQTSEWLFEMENGFKPGELAPALDAHLMAAWGLARQLSRHDLTEDFIVPREPVLPRQQNR